MQALQLAMSHSVCDFSAVQRGGGGGDSNYPAEQKDKRNWKCSEREWVMQGFPKRKPGRERTRETERGKAKWVSESGNERDWQWMYLSRSQIINRDSVVWIERKRGGREREWERVRTWGKRDWGSGAKGTGFRGHEVRMEGRWRNGADGWRIIL